MGSRGTIPSPLRRMQADFLSSSNCGRWSSTVVPNHLVSKPLVSSSVKTGLPLPPPDPISLHETEWDGSWTQDQVRKATPLRRRAGPSKPGRRVLSDVIDPNEEADNEETSFRRVHILPYQGDLLESLIKVGRRCRTLLMEYSDSLKTPASNKIMAQNLEAIIEGFEDILQRGINPFEEIEARATLELHKQIILNWFRRTRAILANVPFGDSSLEACIEKILGFLDPPSRLYQCAYQPAWSSMYRVYEPRRDWSRNEEAPDTCQLPLTDSEEQIPLSPPPKWFLPRLARIPHHIAPIRSSSFFDRQVTYPHHEEARVVIWDEETDGDFIE